ncbi:hypothetical protein [Hyphococcus luteus]|uniref:hypothetical protein n=1 Tax=Hyphococcus luteus TaxID=2058213 RepID=UPI0010572DC9|nr:hypothetical protein [Marinicaulis flavus]
MTLIASINPTGTPILIGDLLLSRQNSELPSVDVPTLGELRHFDRIVNWNRREKTTQVGLAQKINILSENLVIAWSGDYIRARIILRILRDETADSDLSYDLIRKILDKHSDVIEDKVSLIGMLRMSNGVVAAFFQNAHMFDVPGYDEFIYAGSGQFQYYEHLMNFSIGSRQRHNPNRYPQDLLDPAGTAWRLLALELVSGDTLFSYYGGGFEVAYAGNETGMTKIDDVVHFCWYFDVNDLSKPPILWNGVTKCNYKNDDLIINRLLISDSLEQNESHLLLEKRYPVQPLVRRLGFVPKQEDAIESAEIDYLAEWNCNHFYIRLNELRYVLLTSVCHTKSRNSPVKVFVDGGKVRFEKNMDYLEACRTEFLEEVKRQLHASP